MKGFRSLVAWQKAHACALDVYALTRSYPPDERYGLTSQSRRAAVSVASNIAEGCGRGSDADFARFVQIALGSASELEYPLLLAAELGYTPTGTAEGLAARVAEVKRMLSGLRAALKASHSPPADR